MTLKYHQIPSEHWVPEYQISGRPWATSSLATGSQANCHNFHFVTSEFTIFNNGSDLLRVGFRDESFASGAYFEVPASSCCGPYHIRTSQLAILGTGTGQTSYSILAALTAIPEFRFKQPSGDGVGGQDT